MEIGSCFGSVRKPAFGIIELGEEVGRRIHGLISEPIIENLEVKIYSRAYSQHIWFIQQASNFTSFFIHFKEANETKWVPSYTDGDMLNADAQLGYIIHQLYKDPDHR